MNEMITASREDDGSSRKKKPNVTKKKKKTATILTEEDMVESLERTNEQQSFVCLKLQIVNI